MSISSPVLKVIDFLHKSKKPRLSQGKSITGMGEVFTSSFSAPSQTNQETYTKTGES